MPKLKECVAAVVACVREELKPKALIIGGRAMGGRAASMLAAEGFACDGLLLLAYPLHPPGKPEQLRDEPTPRSSKELARRPGIGVLDSRLGPMPKTSNNQV